MTDDLKALADQMRAIAKAWDMPGGGGPVTITLEWADRLDRLRAAKPAVRVKALEFREGPFGWICWTPAAEYTVRKGVKKLKVRIVERQTETVFTEDTLEAAQAACQAHYEAAILSALDAAPEPPGDHIAEAGKMVEPSEDDVERVAEALWERLKGNERIRHLETWRDHARAAIKAMGRHGSARAGGVAP